MPGFDTAATIISDVAREAGLVSSDIANPWASTDEHVLRLVSLLKPTGRELAKAHPWSHLVRQGTFNTTATDADYDLATVCTDFGRLIDDTMWNRTQSNHVDGGVTPQQWQQLKVWSASGVYKSMRLWGEAFHLDPTPTATESIYFEYVSRNWGAASFAKAAPTAAADIIQFDPHLFTRALKLRFLAAKGFDTTDAAADFAEALAAAKGQDGSAPVLAINPRQRVPWPNIPETIG